MADWVAAASAAVSILVTALILLEAKKIRKTEMMRNLMSLWEVYNSSLVETGFLKKFGDIYDLKFDENKLIQDYQPTIWSLINILQFMWVVSRGGMLHSMYSNNQAVGWMYRLRSKRDFFIKFMQDNHLDVEFIEVFKIITSCSSIDEAVLSFKGCVSAKRSLLHRVRA